MKSARMSKAKSRLRPSPASAHSSRPKNRLPSATQELDASQAVRAALGYFTLLFRNGGNLLSSETSPSLEEIERSKDGRFWLVTLGYDAPRSNAASLPAFLRVPAKKLKIFKVNAASGAVPAMKMHPAE